MIARKLAYMIRVLRQEHYSREQLRLFQSQALRELFDYARANVPFYAEKYKKVGVINGLNELRKLPITTRKEYLDAEKRVYSRKFDYLNKELLQDRSTSGSTGTSFKIKYDERAWDYLEAVYARAFFSQGYNPAFKMAYYWYEPLKPKLQNYFGLFRRHYIPCTWPISRQIRELVNGNFKYIHYFSSILYYISRIISDKDARRIHPRAIFTHAELLSPGMKASIMRKFRAPVYDSYGTTEFVRMAWECPICGTYHVCDDSLILEVLDENDEPCKPGQQGRFVVTGLANYVLPLIRYDMGDYGCISKKPNSCGEHFTSIEDIAGRAPDFLLSSAKRFIPPKQIIDALDRLDELAIFKVEQLATTKIRVIALPKKGRNLPVSKIQNTLRKLLGQTMKVYIEKAIPQFSKRGKLRLVENKC